MGTEYEQTRTEHYTPTDLSPRPIEELTQQRLVVIDSPAPGVGSDLNDDEKNMIDAYRHALTRIGEATPENAMVYNDELHLTVRRHYKETT